MNIETNDVLNLTISGQVTVNRAELERVLQGTRASSAPPGANAVQWPKEAAGLPRLAFSMAETAEILGVSYQTVHRLLQRGLLRSSSALRHKIIARTEIERFLRETTRTAF
jgi:hypothetical protein